MKAVLFSDTGLHCNTHFNFYGGVATSLGQFVPKFGVERKTGVPYTPCLLMKPALCLRLHATQSQPCFPDVSNVLALPGDNGIFTATPTERITHYTLHAKSSAKGVPFGNPVLSKCVVTLPPKQKISGCNLLLIHSRIDRLFCCRRFCFLYPPNEYISHNKYA